jgi:hypothetical protein
MRRAFRPWRASVRGSPVRRRQRLSAEGLQDDVERLTRWRAVVREENQHMPRASATRRQCKSCGERSSWACTSCPKGQRFCIKLDRNCFAAYHLGE